MIRLVGLVLAVLPLVAAAPAESAAEPATDFDPASRFDGPITVLDRGERPRAAIRYRPEQGARVTVETVLRVNGQVSTTLPDGRTASSPQGVSPGLAVTLQHSVGRRWRRFVLVNVEAVHARVVDPIPECTTTTFGEQEELSAQLMVDRKGRPSWFLPNDPGLYRREAVEDFVTAVADHTVLFPRVPIGPGARWVTPSVMTIGDRSFEVEQTFVVRTVTPDGVLCDVTMSVPTDARLPGTTFTARGTVHTDLQTLASWFDLTADLVIDGRMTLPDGGEVEMQTTMHMETEARLIE